jgi:hypothetical protein
MQSTVSKAVKQLEIELGVPLLDRKGHRSTLTADEMSSTPMRARPSSRASCSGGLSTPR